MESELEVLQLKSSFLGLKSFVKSLWSSTSRIDLWEGSLLVFGQEHKNESKLTVLTVYSSSGVFFS